MIPGPNSTELTIKIGYDRAGWQGLLAAGAAFFLPAMTLVWALAAVYTRYQALPQVGWLMYGIKPVIIAVVAQALWGLGRTAVKSVPTAAAGVGVIALSAAGLHEILRLFAEGLGVMLAVNWRRLGGRRARTGGARSRGLLVLCEDRLGSLRQRICCWRFFRGTWWTGWDG